MGWHQGEVETVFEDTLAVKPDGYWSLRVPKETVIKPTFSPDLSAYGEKVLVGTPIYIVRKHSINIEKRTAELGEFPKDVIDPPTIFLSKEKAVEHIRQKTKFFTINDIEDAFNAGRNLGGEAAFTEWLKSPENPLLKKMEVTPFIV